MAQPDRSIQPPAVAAPAYIPALDGVRAVSILLVILSHLGLDHVVPGAFGVTLFFFISGYLITRQLLTQINAAGRIGLGRFYLRRALRLVPASLAYVMVSGGLYTLAGGRTPGLAWAAALLYGANYYQLWIGFETTLTGVRQPFNILWSLAIEEHFYLAWPVLLSLVWRKRLWAWGVLGFCIAVLAWRWAVFDMCFLEHAGHLCWKPRPNPLLRYNQLYLATDTRADSIAWGVLLAATEARLSRQGKRPLWIAAAIVLLALSFLLPGPFGRTVLRPTLQGASLLWLLPAMIHQQSVVQSVLASPPAVIVGRLSYSLYLWHWGALGAADWLAGHEGIRWLAAAMSLTIAMATLSYLAIEQPMLRLRRRAGSHVPLSTSGW
jgi:peptidoglycan/LPS O-acetylase OafA/YrhL